MKLTNALLTASGLMALSLASAQAAPQPAALAKAAPAKAAPAKPAAPWMDPKLSADQRARLLLGKMTLEEKVGLLHGSMPMFLKPMPPGVITSAGYVPGLPRLGIPALRESDASLGVANAGRKDDDATPLPSGLATASTWSPELAFAGGQMIGKQARQKGFNVMLAGGVNLIRDPRNGRNFEYLSEDPLLGGVLDGASIRGIQSNHIISTAKHFALNDQETGRLGLSANIGEAAMRESDLLAFEIAIEKGEPGSVMCAYNRINGVFACEDPKILTTALKQDWRWPGFVMSDWGAVHSVESATAGLDQESGQQLDKQVFFDKPLLEAVKDGKISAAKVEDMAHRVLRSMFAKGLFDHPLKPGGLDTAADAAVAARSAEQGVVLLKNEGDLLPLAGARRIAVIGGHADIGVLSGGGSSQVIPQGSVRFPAPKGAPGWGGGLAYHPYPPLTAIKARAKGAEVTYADGTDAAAAAAAAKGADVVIVFAVQWATEGMDTSMTLGDGQDALIEQVAAANPHTIVVLQTANPVLMPWLGKVGAVVEAWYPGARGGETIARVLYGEVNPSGRLPVTFPASEDQLPRPKIPGASVATTETATPSAAAAFDVDYPEGSDVGYRWFAKTGKAPLFWFGHGLSYTSFKYGALKLTGGKTLSASFTVTNTGKRAGIDTPQLYLASGPSRTQQRLLGWSRVALKPGESRTVTITADRRLLADWDEAAHGWSLKGGAYDVFLGADAATPALKASAQVQGAKLAP
jgi:beta-glucosidase